MGENICKLCDQQGINLQNLQMGHTAQYHKSSKPTCAEDPLKQTFLWRRHTDGKQVNVKVFNITNY